jgi:rRNA maturation endonuclease Nob1
MALITCKECGRSISEHADICPHCGKRLEKEKSLQAYSEFTINIPTTKTQLGTGGIVTFISSVFGLISCFLPWYHVQFWGTVTNALRAGVEGVFVFILFAGTGITVLATTFAKRRFTIQVLSLLCIGAGIFVIVLCLGFLLLLISPDKVGPGPGIGLSLACGIGICVGSIIKAKEVGVEITTVSEPAIKCPSCGREAQKEWAFCPYCESKLEILKPTCTSCGKEIKPDYVVCPFCGAKTQKQQKPPESTT